jgi:PAS domain S-box-containing protein
MYDKFTPKYPHNIKSANTGNTGSSIQSKNYLELIEFDKWKNLQTDIEVPFRLDKNDEQIKSHLDIIPIAIITCTKQSKIINANTAAEELFQYRINEIKDQSIYQFFTSESVNEFQRIISEKFKDNQLVKNISIFIKGRKLNGDNIDLKANIIVDKSIDEVVIMLYEIEAPISLECTEKSFQKELDNSVDVWKECKIDERNKPILDKFNQVNKNEYQNYGLKNNITGNYKIEEFNLTEIDFGILFIIDKDYRIRQVSSSIQKFLGLGKEKLYNEYLQSRLFINDVEYFNKFLGQLKQTNVIENKLVVRLLNSNNAYVPFELNGYKNSNGSITIFCYDIARWKKQEKEFELFKSGVNKLFEKNVKEFADLNKQLLKEIEWRTEAENNLKIMEERLELVNEVLNVGLWDYNFISRKIFCNNNFYSILELENQSHQTFSMVDFEKMIYESERNRFNSSFENHIAMLEPVFEVEHRVVTRKNNIKWLLSKGKIIQRDDNANPLRFIGSIEDITLRKRNEEIMQAEFISSRNLNEQKARFVSMLSHQVRNPLSQILSSSEVLETCINELSADERFELIKKIQKSVDNLTELLNNVSNDDISLLEDNQIEIKEFDAVKHFDKLIEEVKIQYPDSARVHFIPDVESILIKTNIKAVEQIFNNLLSNSLKFTNTGKNIYINIKVTDNIFTINLRDEGIGIEYTDQPKIFEPFYKGKNSNDLNDSGIGLTIVKKAVDSLKGNIEFESHPDEGTYFTITIPINEIS